MLGVFDMLLILTFLLLFFLLVRDLLDNPGQTEVADLDDQPLAVDEDVGGLEVAMDHVGGVQILESA